MMGLLSGYLVQLFADAGLADRDAAWSDNDVLGEWLERQQVKADDALPLLTRFFGLPYIYLERNARLQATLVQRADWAVYQLQGDGRYVCLRPPNAAERHAFEAVYGDAPLFLSDAVRVHSALLCGMIADTVQHVTRRRHAVEELLRAEPGHVDGLIGRILDDAIDAEATDVHFLRTDECFRVDFRLDGQIETYAELPSAVADGIVNKLKLLAEVDVAEHRLPQDGHILLRCREADYNLRLGTLPLLNGEKIVLRILPELQRRSSLAALGFTEENQSALLTLLEKARGMVLITGPTNSGKTTTLYACLKQLAAQGQLVYTIEDPIEAVLPEVQQMQVNALSGFSFAAGLRGMLRSDPDVIAVGELRDAETVDIAARAALSGQLVIATLHADNAQEAVDRLRDLGLSDLLLGAVLTAVVNQRLLPQLCTDCGGSGVAADGSVCRRCLGSGRDGRTGVQELWYLSEAERVRVAAGESGFALRKQAQAQGFRTVSDDAQAKGLVL